MRFLVAFALFGSVPALAFTPHLVKDINPLPEATSSAPRSFVTVGDQAFFSAANSEVGAELWRTDGTVAGTFLVADLCPGECSSFARPVAATDRSLFFSVSDAPGSWELWVTEGLPSNTFRLAGPLSVDETSFVWMASRRVFYFEADDGVHGGELWRSDGTPAGTYMVADLNPGPQSSSPRELTELNGRLFFRTSDANQSGEIWTSDGTAQGTVPVSGHLEFWFSITNPQKALVAAGRTLFFLARDPQRPIGFQLWKTDGTSRGTVRLTSFASSPVDLAVQSLTPLGDRLLFSGSPNRRTGLWISDGTPRGTRQLKAFVPLLPGVQQPPPFDKRLIFFMNDGPHGLEPWITDGTPKGTRLIRDVCPGLCPGGQPAEFNTRTGAVLGNLFFFSGQELGSQGPELWVTNGTKAGTHRVRDLCPEGCLGFFNFRAVQGKLFFTTGGRLWRTDGTEQGTVRLTTSSQGIFDPFTHHFESSVLRGGLVFSCGDFLHGQELCHSDGTLQGTELLADLSPEDIGGSNPTGLKALENKVYFVADGVGGSKLWVSDGTDEGTVAVYDTATSNGSNPYPLVNLTDVGGRLFFMSSVRPANLSLWRTADSLPGILELSPENVNVQSSPGLGAVGNRAFFVAIDPDHGEELWTSDGTPAGTHQVADLAPGPAGSAPRNLTTFQGRLYFSADDGTGGRELWRSDGTPGGTVLVKDLDPRPNRGSGPRLLTAHGSRLYFFAEDEDHGQELWSTDGTAAGTALVADLVPGAGGFQATHLISAGSHLFFSGGPSGSEPGLWVSNGTAGGTSRLSDTAIETTERLANPFVFNGALYFRSAKDKTLWTSDGTEASTVRLLDANGLPVLAPESFQIFAGRLFFATSPGGQLFETDGTPAGTVKILDLSGPTTDHFELAPAGSRLFFRKWDPATGTELWALEEN